MFIFVAIVLLAGEILGRPSITSELQYKAFTDFEAEFLSMEGNVTLTPESINGNSKNSTGSRQERGLSDIVPYGNDRSNNIHPNTLLDFFGGIKNTLGTSATFSQKGNHNIKDLENTESVVDVYNAYNMEQVRLLKRKESDTLEFINERNHVGSFELFKLDTDFNDLEWLILTIAIVVPLFLGSFIIICGCSIILLSKYLKNINV